MKHAGLPVGAVVLAVLCAVMPQGGPASGGEETSNDTRREIRLSPSDRDAVRTEMRTFLRSLGSILQGLVGNDLLMVERAARASGMASALNAETTKRLPQEFVQLDTRLHQRFDQTADAARAGKGGDRLKRVAALTGFCVTCHDTYRLEVVR